MIILGHAVLCALEQMTIEASLVSVSRKNCIILFISHIPVSVAASCSAGAQTHNWIYSGTSWTCPCPVPVSASNCPLGPAGALAAAVAASDVAVVVKHSAVSAGPPQAGARGYLSIKISIKTAGFFRAAFIYQCWEC